MKVTFLGTGTSTGVPHIGCKCEVCNSSDKRDFRTRCSAIVQEGNTRILIDCGPDFRSQILKQPFSPLDAVLITHIHYDHVGGIDDLKPFCHHNFLNIYTDEKTIKQLKISLPYCFSDNPYPGIPQIKLNEIKPHQQIIIGDIKITTIEIMHGKMPILGFRLNDFAYITDMKYINDSEIKYLEGVKTLAINALRFEREHHSHQLMKDAIKFSEIIKPQETYIIHINHDMGLHEEVNKQLPKGIQLAYDKQVVDV